MPSTALGLGVCKWSPEGLLDKRVSLIQNTDEILKFVKKKNELIGLHLVDTQAWSCRRPLTVYGASWGYLVNEQCTALLGDIQLTNSALRFLGIFS